MRSYWRNSKDDCQSLASLLLLIAARERYQEIRASAITDEATGRLGHHRDGAHQRPVLVFAAGDREIRVLIWENGTAAIQV